jgi:hypothetical protein
MDTTKDELRVGMRKLKVRMWSFSLALILLNTKDPENPTL